MGSASSEYTTCRCTGVAKTRAGCLQSRGPAARGVTPGIAAARRTLTYESSHCVHSSRGANVRVRVREVGNGRSRIRSGSEYDAISRRACCSAPSSSVRCTSSRRKPEGCRTRRRSDDADQRQVPRSGKGRSHSAGRRLLRGASKPAPGASSVRRLDRRASNRQTGSAFEPPLTRRRPSRVTKSQIGRRDPGLRGRGEIAVEAERDAEVQQEEHAAKPTLQGLSATERHNELVR